MNLNQIQMLAQQRTQQQQMQAQLLAQMQQRRMLQQQLAGGGLASGLTTPSGNMNRIYVGGLLYELNEENVKAAFAPFGPITSVEMPREPTGKSKGFCFVEYADVASAQKALVSMNGAMLGGRAIKVGRPTQAGAGPMLGGGGMQLQAAMMAGMGGMGGMLNPALMLAQRAQALQNMQAQAVLQRNLLQQRVLAGGAVGAVGAAATAATNKIYVGSVPYNVTEGHLEDVFKAFGKVLSISLIPNAETGQHKGYGFVEYEKVESAMEAIKVGFKSQKKTDR